MRERKTGGSGWRRRGGRKGEREGDRKRERGRHRETQGDTGRAVHSEEVVKDEGGGNYK